MRKYLYILTVLGSLALGSLASCDSGPVDETVAYILNREEAEKVKDDMEEIATNEYYEVEKLTHSIPYLIPQAADLLEDIGRNFQDSLKNRNASI